MIIHGLLVLAASAAFSEPQVWPQPKCRGVVDMEKGEQILALTEGSVGKTAYEGDLKKDFVEVFSAVTATGRVKMPIKAHLGGEGSDESIVYLWPLREPDHPVVLDVTESGLRRIRHRGQLTCAVAHAYSHVLRDHGGRLWKAGNALTDRWLLLHGHRYLDGTLDLETLEDDLSQAVCADYKEASEAAERQAQADALKLTQAVARVKEPLARDACAGRPVPSAEIRWVVPLAAYGPPGEWKTALKRRIREAEARRAK